MLAVIETPEGFAAFLAARLASDRQYAEARMRTTCTVDRIRLGADGNPMTTTSSTGVVTEVRDDVYVGKCRVGKRESFSLVDVAGASVTVAGHPISFPIDAPHLQVGDRITVTADLDTPAIVGDIYRVIAPGTGSQETAQRVPCQRVEDGVAA